MKNRALWILAAISLAWGVAVLAGYSDGALSLFDATGYYWGVRLFAVVTAIVAMVVLVRGLRRGTDWRRLFPLPLLLQAGLLLVVSAAIQSDLPFQLRFDMSRASLEKA